MGGGGCLSALFILCHGCFHTVNEVTKFFVLPPGLLLFSFIPFMLFTLTTILVLDNIIIEAEEPRVINSQ